MQNNYYSCPAPIAKSNKWILLKVVDGNFDYNNKCRYSESMKTCKDIKLCVRKIHSHFNFNRQHVFHDNIELLNENCPIEDLILKTHHS